MDRRLLIPLLGAAALVMTAVPRAHWGAQFGGAQQSGAAPSGGAQPPAGGLSARVRDLTGMAHGPRHAARATPRPRLAPDTVDAALAVEVPRDGTARFSLAVVNTADRRVEVNFPDGRTRDFAVYDDAGREVWRWSRGRLFTQLMQNKLLQARDSAVYDEAWPTPAPGRYTVVAELRSNNHPIRRAAAFVVPAPIPPGAVAQAAGAPAPVTP